MNSKADAYPKIKNALSLAIKEFNSLQLCMTELKLNGDEPLMGNEGLDSMGLVHFIVLVEDKLYDEFNEKIDLSSDAAFSQERSPFSNMNSFVEFISDRLNR